MREDRSSDYLYDLVRTTLVFALASVVFELTHLSPYQGTAITTLTSSFFRITAIKEDMLLLFGRDFKDVIPKKNLIA